MKLIYTFLFSCFLSGAFAQKITGTVKDEKGQLLPYASVFIKGTTIGTTANENGRFILPVEKGNYTLVCQYISFSRQEKTVQVSGDNVEVNFVLPLQKTQQQVAVVKGGGEDPAYAIIRKAIAKRSTYNNEVNAFICDAYIKSNGKLLDAPKKMFGQKVETDEVKDTTGRKLMFLTESVTRVYYKKPEFKLEVLSGRNSSSQSGFGLNFPTFINFYDNNVSLGDQLNPRGFISPVSENAIHYYKFKYLGFFTEDGKDINQIRVTARRGNEPTFSGIINIMDDSWRIHSLDLSLGKQSGVEILDSIAIRQFFVPVDNVYRLKDNIIFARFRQFGFNVHFNLVNIYQNYNLKPEFPPKYFGKMLMKYDTAFNKKDSAYWAQTRPMPLDTIEIRDYKEKDSIRIAQRSDTAGQRKRWDSLRRKYNKVTVKKILWSGYQYGFAVPKKRSFVNFGMEPLLKSIQYNTVEGLVLQAHLKWTLTNRKNKEVWRFNPHLRYGISNTRLNGWIDIAREKSDSTSRGWYFSGGKQVFQFNRDEPISPLYNAIYTLTRRQNYMKIYEAYTGDIAYRHNNLLGLKYTIGTRYEDRMPLENTTDFSFRKTDKETFTPNYPTEILTQQFQRHQALQLYGSISYQPGVKYIQMPRQRVPLGSKYPVFTLDYAQGLKNLLGSDVSFAKWRLSMSDTKNFKLRGSLSYRLGVGGFLNRDAVPVQDLQHFNGNQLLLAAPYLNSFQIAPYYANSTDAKLYAIGHAEHHFNGFLTNKIPLFNRLKWNLVAGSNAFYVNKDNNYVEAFMGLENIFKVLRVDVVTAYRNGAQGEVGVRLGFGGLFSNMMQRGNR
jgi:hypothetical protein